MSAGWTAERIVAQSQRWRSSWHPPRSVYGIVDGLEFYHLDDEVTLLNYHGDVTDPLHVLDAALALARGRGAASLRMTVGPGLFAEIDDADLRRRGAQTVAVIDIRALIITDATLAALPNPDHIVIRPADSPASDAEFAAITTEVFGYPPPILHERTALEGLGEISDHVGLFLADVDGSSVGAAGYMQVGSVARMFGAAVRESARGRGVYRALTAARLRDVHAHGADLAIVHAEHMSSPILDGVGFAKFGERRLTRLPATRDQRSQNP